MKNKRLLREHTHVARTHAYKERQEFKSSLSLAARARVWEVGDSQIQKGRENRPIKDLKRIIFLGTRKEQLRRENSKALSWRLRVKTEFEE